MQAVSIYSGLIFNHMEQLSMWFPKLPPKIFAAKKADNGEWPIFSFLQINACD